MPMESSFVVLFEVFIESKALSMRFPVIVTSASDGMSMSSWLKCVFSWSVNFTLHSLALAIFPISKAAREGFCMLCIMKVTVSFWIIEMFWMYFCACSYWPIWMRPSITWSLFVKSWLFALMESTRNFVPSKSSVKSRNCFFIFFESRAHIEISINMAPKVTRRKRSTVWLVTVCIVVFSCMVMMKPS